LIRKRNLRARKPKYTTKIRITTKNTKAMMKLAIACMILKKRLMKRKKVTVKVLHLTTQAAKITRRYSKEMSKKAKTPRKCITLMELCTTNRMLHSKMATLRKAKIPIKNIMMTVNFTRMTKMSILVTQRKSKTPIKCITLMAKLLKMPKW